jgi:RND family efflux transporter MFP subunit
MDKAVELVRVVRRSIVGNRKLVIGGLVGLALLLGGCGRTQPVTTANAAAPVASEPVRPASPQPQAYLTTGPLVVENQVDVSAQREGVVARVIADVGTSVRRGDVLGELDNRQLSADIDAAEARVRSAQFQMQHFSAEIKLRETDLSRDEAMYKAELIPTQQLDHSRYAVESQKFEEQREREYLKAAQDTLKSLQLEFEKTRIVAPFDGVVARRYVRAGQKVALNDRLFWVTAMSPLTVRFTVPQEFTGKMRRGDEVSVASPADPGQAHAARVTSVSPVVDPASGTLEVQAQVVGGAAGLVPGMTVNIRVNQPR